MVKWVIDDGTAVKEGDLLVDLDDSPLQDQLNSQRVVRDKAEGEKIKAEEDYNIQLSINESAVKTAEVNLELALIDLDKYTGGDFPQALKDVEGRIKQAESDVDQQKERAAWAKRMVKKGFLTAVQAQAEQSKLEGFDLALGKVKEELRVLTDPNFGMKKRTETDLQNKIAEARRALERAKRVARASEIQTRGVRESLKSVFEQERARYTDIESEIKKCKVRAPQEGMVVYYVPPQVRFGSGTQQSIIAQGEPVREGQKLLQIPDLRYMQIDTRVHEAMVSHVHPEQPALIRVDAFPDRRLKGRVVFVATVSSQADWLSSDVKVYQTKVMIDDPIPGLKPGMGANVTITIGDALEHVLTVPVQAIVGSAEMGKNRQLVVMTADGPEIRDAVVGMSNDKMAEIKEGLKEGDEVVLNPRTVLGDKIKTGKPGRGKGDGGEKSGGEKKKGGKDRSKAAPDRPPAEKAGNEERPKAMMEKARSASYKEQANAKRIPRTAPPARMKQQGTKMD